MRFTNLFAISLLAALQFGGGVAHAEGLSQHNARVVFAANKMTTAVSSRTGARTGNRVAASYGRSDNANFRGMVKLAMKFEMGDGRVMTEHCGGTVIDSRWIVTAAHCVSPADGARWDRIEIITGDADLDGTRTIRRTAQHAIIHGGFQYATLTNDIALVRLSEPLPRRIVPAKMDAQARPSISKGGIARTAGWPVTGAKAGARTLQTTNVAVFDASMSGFITVSSATGALEGVCQGESGGPLMSWSTGQAQLAGVLSGIEPGTENSDGEPCMMNGYEMYFTPIAKYRAWISRIRSVCSYNPESCTKEASLSTAQG